MVAGLEADNLAAAESRVRSEEDTTKTTALAAVHANLGVPENFAAWHDQSVCRLVSNVMHELAIDGIAGPAARRSWSL
jgi:hypothetical protein